MKMNIGRVFFHSVGFVWLGIFMLMLGIWTALWWAVFQ